ncbi:MAG: hypothetical protein VST65_04500 [Nitrospirota bacterium]|jgi:hypothetical protein|nr:hypothetical protein [Nitrospirota bacterium]
MKCWIEKDSGGRDVIVTDRADAARNGPSTITSQGLPADHVYIRLNDGQCFTTSTPLARLSPAEAEMIGHYLAERGAPDLDVFTGEPVG